MNIRNLAAIAAIGGLITAGTVSCTGSGEKVDSADSLKQQEQVDRYEKAVKDSEIAYEDALEAFKTDSLELSKNAKTFAKIKMDITPEKLDNLLQAFSETAIKQQKVLHPSTSEAYAKANKIRSEREATPEYKALKDKLTTTMDMYKKEALEYINKEDKTKTDELRLQALETAVQKASEALGKYIEQTEYLASQVR